MTSPAAAPAVRSIVPGPPGYPLLGVLPHLRRDPLGFVASAGLRYGGVARLDLGPRPVFLVSDAEAIKHVLQTNVANYPKIDALKPLLGEGLATSDGELWRRQRRLIQPAFHRQRLAQFADLMTAHARAMLERWQGAATAGEPLNLADEAAGLTQEVIVRSMFSRSIDADAAAITQAFLVALAHLNGLVFSPLRAPAWVPTPANRRFTQAVKYLDDFMYGLIAERKRDGLAGHGDLLDLLLEAKDEAGESMSERQVRDEMLIIFLAGQDTTAAALSWAGYELARHPELQEQMADEARAAFGDRLPGVDDLACLPFTRRVVDETLRLYPPAWIIARKAAADDELGGYRLPKGSMVMLSPYVAHRRLEVWANPEAFDPDRFLPERAASRPRYAYVPFGGGARICIGNNFALMQATLTLAMAARRFRWHLDPGRARVQVKADLTLRPAPGVFVRLSPR